MVIAIVICLLLLVALQFLPMNPTAKTVIAVGLAVFLVILLFASLGLLPALTLR